MKSRTQSRRSALQILFELDQTSHSLGVVLEMRSNENDLDQEQIKFTQTIVTGVLKYFQKLDEIIAQNAPEWPLEQVAIIDRNILRIALWELAIYQKTPLKVVINEAIELAKSFGTDSAPRFVNGVLGSLADEISKIKATLNQ